MNIFGHTGMKGGGNTALWANYPESNAWMMAHVWDHFDFTNDIAWWKEQGYPLLKGVAEFHLDKLIPDLHFNDSTLVVSPCNSPEQSPITLGCAHAQQLIWQLFNAVEKGFSASGDNDHAFLREVQTKRQQMDKGLHIGSWGQLQGIVSRSWSW
jgi:alpha-L-fucosidase 2